MRDRVMGTENEFGVIVEKEDGSFACPSDMVVGGMVGALIDRQRDVMGFMLPYRSSSLWLPNGGCVYLDMTTHLEYASPECRRVRDVVAYNKAGELIAEKIFSSGFISGDRLRLIKNAIAGDRDRAGDENATVTFGAHENYLFFDEGNTSGLFAPAVGKEAEARRALFLPLMGFLATRQILDGAGRWMNADVGNYAFSQRAEFMQKEIELATTTDRPIITMRAEHHTGALEKTMKRLHLIVGDANILDTALFLKIGTTMLMLSLFEERKMPDIRLKSPARALSILSRVYDVNTPCIELENGTHASAFSIQSAFCEAARHYLSRTSFESEESEAEAWEILFMWEEALDALSNWDIEWMVGRLDHATKGAIASRKMRLYRSSPVGLSDSIVRKAVEAEYHEIGEHGLSEVMRKKWPEKCIVSDEDILRATEEPPPDTRAYARGMAVRGFLEKRVPLKEVAWAHISSGTMPISIDFNNSVYPKYTMDNPFVVRPQWFNDVCGKKHSP